jgi:hypothetical protein
LAVAGSRSGARCSIRATIADVTGRIARASGSNAGSSRSSTRSGFRRTMKPGITCSQRITNPRSATMRRPSDVVLCTSVALARNSTATRTHVAISSRTGTNSRSGSSRYSPSRSLRPPRSAIRRSDSRISELNAACTQPKKIVAHARRKTASGVIGSHLGMLAALSGGHGGPPLLVSSLTHPRLDRAMG